MFWLLHGEDAIGIDKDGRPGGETDIPTSSAPLLTARLPSML
jgi:hypothetical protein